QRILPPGGCSQRRSGAMAQSSARSASLKVVSPISISTSSQNCPSSGKPGSICPPILLFSHFPAAAPVTAHEGALSKSVGGSGGWPGPQVSTGWHDPPWNASHMESSQLPKLPGTNSGQPVATGDTPASVGQ